MRIVSGYRHLAGFHCGSTAVRSLMEFFGHALSEPMALGLGQVLFVAVFDDLGLSPSRFLFTRSAELEMEAFRALGCRVALRQTDDPDEAWAQVRQRVDRDEPVMLQVDLSELPYFNTKIRFAGHKILLIGHDEAAGTALVSDNEFAQPQVVALEDLGRARYQSHFPFDLRHNWFDVEPPDTLRPFEESVPAALRGQAQKLLEGNDILGLPALEKLSKTLPKWAEATDWAWSASFAYQVIERRGTGGGGFRLKYAEFLTEAAPYCPLIAKYDLPARMRSIAATWTKLALALKAIGDRTAPDGFDEAAKIVGQIVVLERNFCQAVMDNVATGPSS